MTATHSNKLLDLAHSLSCKVNGHNFYLLTKRVEEGGSVSEYECRRCGATKVVTATIAHNCCPDCGGNVIYDASRPKTYVGTDTYCDENAYGEWYCDKCGRVGDEDFSGCHIGMTEVITPIQGKPESHVLVGGRDG